jgi:hypothetical protein
MGDEFWIRTQRIKKKSGEDKKGGGYVNHQMEVSPLQQLKILAVVP